MLLSLGLALTCCYLLLSSPSAPPALPLPVPPALPLSGPASQQALPAFSGPAHPHLRAAAAAAALELPALPAALASTSSSAGDWERVASDAAAAGARVTSPGFPELEFFRTRTPSPFTMVCFKGDYVCADIKGAGFRKEWSEGLGLLIMDLDPATDFFIDFGANTGFFGLAAAARGVATLAVEPAQAAICRLNAAINGFSPALYDFHGLALVQEAGAGPMKQIVPWQNMGGSTLVEASSTTSWTTLFSEELAHMDITVPTSTIDEVVRARVLAPRRAVKLLKIDVEGFEVFAWRGGQQLLASGLVYQIVAEWHPRFLVSAGVAPSEYLRIMIKCVCFCPHLVLPSVHAACAFTCTHTHTHIPSPGMATLCGQSSLAGCSLRRQLWSSTARTATRTMATLGLCSQQRAGRQRTPREWRGGGASQEALKYHHHLSKTRTSRLTSFKYCTLPPLHWQWAGAALAPASWLLSAAHSLPAPPAVQQPLPAALRPWGSAAPRQRQTALHPLAGAAEAQQSQRHPRQPPGTGGATETGPAASPGWSQRLPQKSLSALHARPPHAEACLLHSHALWGCWQC